MAGILNFIQIEQEGSFAYAHADSGSFGDSLYFSLVTILTVGYGDIVPVSALAKFATIACTLAIYYIVPSGIMEAIREHRYGQGAHDLGLLTSKGRNVREQHIVLCGSVTLDNLAATLREIFHSDHGAEMRWVRVIVLSNRKPTAEISVLLDSPTYRYRVAYVVGSPLNSKDLERARVEEAAGVMVLVDKMAANERLEDMDVMMQAISALSHVQVQRRAGHGPRLLVGLVLPTSALHLRTAGMRSVVSSVQLKLSILAQSCRCPGWAAMVSNLIRSHAKLPPEVLEAGSWLAEYYIGATKTFYSISFSPVFVGQLFSSVVATVFEHFELIIAAVEKPSGTVLLNPGPNYRIRKEDRAYVLAESQKDALAVWAYLGEFHEATKNGEQAKLLEAVARSKAAVSSAAGFIQSLRQGRMLLTCKARLRPGVLPMEEVAMAIVEVLQAGKAKVGVPVWDILAQCGMKIDQGSAKLQHASGRSVAISPAESRVAPPRRRSLLGMSGPVGRQLSDLVEESVWSVPSVREEEHSQASVPGAMSPLLSPPPVCACACEQSGAVVRPLTRLRPSRL
jgi:voltage-gated potassium channel Kch